MQTAGYLEKTRFGLPGTARLMVDALQPVDPLRTETRLPSIEIVVPFVLKDLDTLVFALVGAVSSSRNPISRIVLITPQRTFERFPGINGKVQKFFDQQPALQDLKFEVRKDEDVVSKAVLAFVGEMNLEPRDRGWVLQQMVKISTVLSSESTGALVVDADTILMMKRTWVAADGRQILMMGQESRDPFFSFANDFLGLEGRIRLSFITHHQLMQPKVLKEIFATSEGLIEMLHKASRIQSTSSPLRAISEYEIYGAYLSEKFSGRCKFASWGNGSGTRDDIGPRRTGDAVWALSVSYHHYLSGSNISDSQL